MTNEKGKMPAMNMVTIELQQVTTRSKAKLSEWDLQEDVRNATKEWVNEAKNTNVARMLEENVGKHIPPDG